MHVGREGDRATFAVRRLKARNRTNSLASIGV
jgi:hypothetical protein